MLFKHGIIALPLLFGSALNVLAQAPPAVAPQGVGTTMSLQGGPEYIDPTTLKFTFPINVRHKAGSGLDFDATLSFSADPSHAFDQTQPNWGGTFTDSINVWTLGLASGTSQPVLSANETINSCGYSNSGVPLYEYTYAIPIFTDKYGIEREFNFIFADATECSGGNPNYYFRGDNSGNVAYASDGSGISLTGLSGSAPNFTIAYPDGTGLTVTMDGYQPNHGTSPSTLVLAQDANGNQITTNSAGTAVIDTLGQTVLTGLTLSNGAISNWGTLSYQNSAQTTYNVTPSNQGSPLSSLTMPNGQQYLFANYDAMGRLTGVTLPSGGSITYDYGALGTSGSNQTLTRTINDNNGNSSVWTYTLGYNSSGQKTTTIVDPAKTGTVITYQAAKLQSGLDPYSSTNRYLEIGRQTFSTFTTAPVLLSTITTSYVGAQSNSSYVILPIQSETVTTSIPASAGVISSQTVTTYNGIGQVSEVDTSDFGTAGNGVGPLLSKVVTAFQQTGYSYSNTNQPYKINSTTYPGSVTVYDGSNNMVHKSIPTYGSTGLLTQLQQWVSGSTYLTTQFSYYANGVPYSVTDPNGAVSYTYSTQCVLPNNPVNGYWGGYPSGTSVAVKNSAGTPTGTLSTSQTWDCVAGVPLNSTDVNGNQSSAVYNDPLFRMTSSTDWLGNTTNYTYPTASNHSSETVMTFNSGASTSDTLVSYDGLGRPILNQTRQGPTATTFDTVSTTYDSYGRPYTTSLPYTAAAGTVNTSAAHSTIVYDLSNRPYQATSASGATVQYTYSGNDTLITTGPTPTGEQPKVKQLEYNALGQLSSVCEITSGSRSGPCSQTSSQTGYFTKYTYSADLLTSVSQNIQTGGGGSQTRTMSYDGLGRKLSETLPETGLSSFVYDSDPAASCSGSFPGDQIKSTDAMGNVTCATYDNRHRIQSTTVASGAYSGATPNHNYVYDAATVNGVAMQNVKGALAEAYTCVTPCTSLITDVGMSMTPEVSGNVATGRVLSQLYEATPHSNGYSLTAATSYPNGTLGVLTGQGSGNSYTMPTVRYGLDGEGRPVTATDTTAPVNPLNLVTSTAYNPAGEPTAVSFGNGDTDNPQFDSTYRPTGFSFNVAGANSFSLNGTLRYNTDSSIQQMIIADTSDPNNSQTCNYSADALSRLNSVSCGAWNQTFAYDPFGNIKKTGNGGSSYGANYDETGPPHNQVSSGTPAGYDANGNQTMGVTGSFTYDAAGQAVSANGSTQATYDALGRMVETVTGSSSTQFVYSPLGTQYAVVQNGTLTRGTVPLPGGAAAVYNSAGLNYIRHTDQLGSSRLATTWAHAVYSKDAYAPFGEPYDETAPATDRSFTGQGSDLTQGVGLFDFQFRKLDSTAGRWLTPDPSGWDAVDMSNPQTLNRYAYVNNAPLDSVDPLGLHMVQFQSWDCMTYTWLTQEEGGYRGHTQTICTPNTMWIDVPDTASGYIQTPSIGGGMGGGGIQGGFNAIAQIPTIHHAPNTGIIQKLQNFQNACGNKYQAAIAVSDTLGYVGLAGTALNGVAAIANSGATNLAAHAETLSGLGVAKLAPGVPTSAAVESVVETGALLSTASSFFSVVGKISGVVSLGATAVSLGLRAGCAAGVI